MERERSPSPRAGPDRKGNEMPEFMDVHKGMVGITRETLMEAHQADLDIQDDEGVNFKHTGADPESGRAGGLAEAPNAEAVKKIHRRTGHPAEEVFPVPVQV